MKYLLGFMIELFHIELPTQFSIDAFQQIHIEIPGNSLPIVIRGLENLGILSEINSNQELVLDAQHGSNYLSDYYYHQYSLL